MENLYNTILGTAIRPLPPIFISKKKRDNECREKKDTDHYKLIIHNIQNQVAGLLKNIDFQILENSRQLDATEYEVWNRVERYNNNNEGKIILS